MEKKKAVIYSTVALIALVILVVGATYAYFQNQYGSASNADVKVTTYTTDVLTFETGDAINISADQEKFAQGKGNQTGSTFARATLQANNKTNTATANYYMYLNIENNSFTYTGTYQKYDVKLSSNYKLQVWGASGGGGSLLYSENSHGGLGGYSVGTIHLEKGSTLYLYIGGAGSYGSGQSAYGGPIGGFNGGGNGGNSGSGSGGGATDIRVFANEPTASDLIWSSSTGLASRVIVAGGGGGSDDYIGTRYGGNDGSGGAGGGLVAEGAWIDGGLYSGYAATQTSGYALGVGQPASASADTGGGGGGYYGGLVTNQYNGGAGGGSGYLSPKLTDSKTIVGTASMPTHDGSSTMTGNAGNGFASISLVINS